MLSRFTGAGATTYTATSYAPTLAAACKPAAKRAVRIRSKPQQTAQLRHSRRIRQRMWWGAAAGFDVWRGSVGAVCSHTSGVRICVCQGKGAIAVTMDPIHVDAVGVQGGSWPKSTEDHAPREREREGEGRGGETKCQK